MDNQFALFPHVHMVRWEEEKKKQNNKNKRHSLCAIVRFYVFKHEKLYLALVIEDDRTIKPTQTLTETHRRYIMSHNVLTL